MLVSLECGTVLFEAKEGPYVATTDKEFAAWAPPETDIERGRVLMAELRVHFAAVIEGASAENKQ